MENQIEKEEIKEENVVDVEPENNEDPIESEPEPITYSSQSLADIEQERLNFFKKYKVQNSFKWLVSFICIVAIIVGCIIVPNFIVDNDNLKTGIMLGVCIFALGGTFGYSVFTKRSMSTRMRKYFNHYYNKINEFAFDQEGFANSVLQEPGKIDIAVFKDTNLYKDIVDVGSRGLTEFEYHGIPMRICDCAGNIKDDKRIRPVFVGKMLHCATSYLDSQTIVVYFKGDERALPPTNVSDLKVLEDNTKYAVYSNNEAAKKVISSSVKKMFDEVEMNKYLVDLTISMHDGKMFVLFGYDDPLMVLPLQNQFDPKPNEQFKADLTKIIKIVEALNK